ncbi:MAG: hypothetical protein GXY07_11565 [Candidatus Hydrogenedentes bacterium]|nr:hypothetical protein [Candidatus Hydrogenedentota bacterium]
MRKRGIRLVAGLMAVTLCYCVAVAALFGADRARTAEGMDEVLYLPNEKLLTHFTGGLNSVIADLLWLNCIQYTAREHHGLRHFTWLEAMLTTSTRLDPYFTDVYRLGAIFLAALRADADASLNLIRTGMLHNPHSWHLPYEAAMVYLMNKREEPDARYLATRYLSMSIATGNAPGGIANLTAKLQDEFSLTEIEQDTWKEMLHSEDEFLRELAQRKLIEIDLRHVCRIMNEALGIFKSSRGRPAASLEELVTAGLLRAIPEDPLGGSFFLGSDGVAYNTTLLDDVVNRTLNPVINALDSYNQQHQAWPPDLETLVRTGFLKEIPKHPYPDQHWEYDPSTGHIQ